MISLDLFLVSSFEISLLYVLRFFLQKLTMRFDAFQIQPKSKSDLFALLLILYDSFLPDWFRLLIKTSIFREEFYNRK